MPQAPTFPQLPPPSAGSTLAFVAIVWLLVAALWSGSWYAGHALGEAPEVRRRWSLRTALALFALLGVSGALTASGVMRTYALPPPLGLYALGSLVLAVLAARSRFGERLARGVPLVALVGVQAFRLPLELVLHRWHQEAVIPVQMTYTGHNFDIVSGSFALLAALYMLVTKTQPRALVWAFNVVGSALLAAVTTIAILSSPLPIRAYDGPLLLIGVYFPFGWIVPICVGGALFGHLVLFRALVTFREGRASLAQ